MSEKEISLKTVNNACCGAEAKAVILGCSGGSNVGQIANNLMIELDKSGVGNAYLITATTSCNRNSETMLFM